jgi:hypothetical protein
MTAEARVLVMMLLVMVEMMRRMRRMGQQQFASLLLPQGRFLEME